MFRAGRVTTSSSRAVRSATMPVSRCARPARSSSSGESEAVMREGDELPGLSVRITRGGCVRYAGASLDFNPIHWNERFARTVGLDDVIAHGMLTMGLEIGRASCREDVKTLEAAGRVNDQQLHDEEWQ